MEQTVKRSILLVSFQYPPVQASSGLLRVLAFSKHLKEFGWEVHVLTANVSDDPIENKENNQLLPDGVNVIRTKAIDAATKLSFRGRYPDILEWPDRYSFWVLSATLAGYRQLRKQHVDVIFSTYPIASAQLVGYCLAKLTGKPWIADFRDPMVMKEHPDTKLRRQAHTWVEKKAVETCSVALVTNQHAKQHYVDKFPYINPKKFHILENGFDEELFQMAEAMQARTHDGGERSEIRVLHSGTLYPNHRDPSSLFRAIQALAPEWALLERQVKFIFRASGYDDYYQSMVTELDIEKYVEFLEPVGYVESMSEMLSCEALLLIQGSSCNQQVPAKLYEYLRSGRPIIAVTDPTGATASTLREAGISNILSGTPTDSIEDELRETIAQLSSVETRLDSKSPDTLKRFSRRYWSEYLDSLLHELLVDDVRR